MFSLCVSLLFFVLASIARTRGTGPTPTWSLRISVSRYSCRRRRALWSTPSTRRCCVRLPRTRSRRPLLPSGIPRSVPKRKSGGNVPPCFSSLAAPRHRFRSVSMTSPRNHAFACLFVFLLCVCFRCVCCCGCVFGLLVFLFVCLF